MSNRRCAAKTCFNLQGCRPNLKFFPFPKDELTSHQWVVNCGRTDLLDKSVDQLTKFLLCADHFETHWFLNPKYKTVFIRTGQPIPTIFHNNLADFVPKALRENVKLRNQSLEPGEDKEQSAPIIVAEKGDIVEDPVPYQETGVKKRGCHKMCRLCACLVYEDKLISMFSEDSVKECVPFKINRLLPDKIEEDDGLPHHVCSSCITKLNECSHTVEAFIAADKKLRNLFQNSDSISHGLTYIKLEEEPDKNTDVDLGDGVLPDSLSEFLTVREGSVPLHLEHPSNGFVSSDQKKVYIITKRRHETADSNISDDNIGDCVDSVLDTVLEGSCEPFDEVATDCYQIECISGLNGQTEQEVCLKNEEITDIPGLEESREDGVETNEILKGKTKGIEDSSKPYQCTVCGKTFKGKNKLLIHEINQHACENIPDITTTKKYKKRETHSCNECGNSFNGLKPLKRHIREHHIPTENICEFCGAHYKIKSQLDVHRRLHTDEKPFSCVICKESFHFKKALKRHKRVHVEPKSLTCTICNKTFGNRSAKWRHEKIHTSSRNVLCYLCGKVLSNSQSLRVHMRTHSSDRPCSCPTCGKTFKDNVSVTKHMVMHTAEKNFKCDVCGRAFYSKGLVKQHQLSHSGVKPHHCEICGAAFNRLGNLNQHKKKHGSVSTETPRLSHECVVCGKWMKSELTLKYHLAKHTGEKKPFDCEVCGKRFVAVDPYRVHMRIHTGERPYECDACNKTFRSAFTLKQHAALHRDEHPYPCPFCERRFKRLQSLVVHRRTHTGEKPHPCPVCGRCFAQKGDMLKHTRTHRDRPRTPVVMELEHITELVLSDTDITSEFLIDMPIVEVETEMQPDINSELQSHIQSEINSVMKNSEL